jgi:hypothetical protein
MSSSLPALSKNLMQLPFMQRAASKEEQKLAAKEAEKEAHWSSDQKKPALFHSIIFPLFFIPCLLLLPVLPVFIQYEGYPFRIRKAMLWPPLLWRIQPGVGSVTFFSSHCVIFLVVCIVPELLEAHNGLVSPRT